MSHPQTMEAKSSLVVLIGFGAWLSMSEVGGQNASSSLRRSKQSKAPSQSKKS